ncbi:MULTISPECIES: sigma-70 family RNA polymerase sigma factor [Glycomyces]|uniref:RNA polymerase sigma-70 factor (ECF subfamily) n=2 Tax=Glycomyces TaxID=58113 RepID=A0A9X3SXD3_9ACTN|nr:sigma-70 family RNA polymerase sigma factor [Glycomyces lechevalierae]MDA1386507.1 sigma-70 family RNA polymerase sigma factor [Glycomyces lechevalierae]MDA1388259.1 sigma-70 family RNA polymerase sigma factor [Glycomyces lechevalierae]MDR7339024.1 RNA polymerase sigma-70 factor (ECF subfamily) [Glycomyces lechevalierae]
MNDDQWLAERFETDRPRLEAVAFRMLGSSGEAEDAVQEAWFRLAASDTARIDNLSGWLTTVVGRVCLDQLRRRKSRAEQPMPDYGTEPTALPGPADVEADPESAAVIADSVSLALLVVLETLDPAERLAFVLHDMFGVPFDDIAQIVDRTPTAARKLASRARARVRGTDVPQRKEVSKQRSVVEAFLAAARGGDFEALVSVLDPEITLRTDAAEVGQIIRGAAQIAGGAMTFAAMASAAQLVLADGKIGVISSLPNAATRVLVFTVEGDRIIAMEGITDPDRVRGMELTLLDA